MAVIDSDSRKEEEIDDPVCCDNPSIKEIGGDRVCEKCGLVVGSVYHNSRRLSYSIEDFNQRVSDFPVVNDFGPRTTIGRYGYGDYSNIQPKDRYQFQRLSRIHNSLISAHERNLWRAIPRLIAVAGDFQFSSVCVDEAKNLYKRCVYEKITMGRTINGTVAAVIFGIIRLNRMPYSLDDVVNSTGLPKKQIHRLYHLIVDRFQDLTFEPLSAVEYISKFVSHSLLNFDLQCQFNVSKTAKEFLSCIPASYTCGKDPRGVAGAVIYLAAIECDVKRTQIHVARVSHVTEVTLRTRAKAIRLIIWVETEGDG